MSAALPTEPAESATGYAVRLTARLPDGEANGLRAFSKDLCTSPRVTRYAVIELDTARVIDDVDTETDTAVVRILRIEVVPASKAKQAKTLLASSAKERGPMGLFDEDESE